MKSITKTLNRYIIQCRKCGMVLFKKSSYELDDGEIKCRQCGDLKRMPEDVILVDTLNRGG